jgi:hypothetical protein
MGTAIGKMLFVFLLIISATPSFAATDSKGAETPKGCPLPDAVRSVDEFVDGRNSEIAEISSHALSEQSAAVANANQPGVAVGRQMTAEEQDRFNIARHAMIQTTIEAVNLSDFQRDVHVISEVFGVAKLADLYDVKQSDLGRDDPRQFYYKILLMLQANQPKPTRTALIRSGIDCDPEAGLFMEEEFASRQIAQNSVLAPQMQELVADIERLRVLYQVVWKTFGHSADDVRAMRWNGDDPFIPDTVTPMIEGSDDVSKRIYKIVVAYIDSQMPTETTFEARHRQKIGEKAERDFPLKDQ